MITVVLTPVASEWSVAMYVAGTKVNEWRASRVFPDRDNRSVSFQMKKADYDAAGKATETSQWFIIQGVVHHAVVAPIDEPQGIREVTNE